MQIYGKNLRDFPKRSALCWDGNIMTPDIYMFCNLPGWEKYPHVVLDFSDDLFSLASMQPIDFRFRTLDGEKNQHGSQNSHIETPRFFKESFIWLSQVTDLFGALSDSPFLENQSIRVTTWRSWSVYVVSIFGGRPCAPPLTQGRKEGEEKTPGARMQRGNKPQVPWGFPLELLRFFNMGNQCRQREMNLKAIEARKARMSMMIYIYNIYISIYRQIVTQRERERERPRTY